MPTGADGQVSISLFEVTIVDNLRFGLSIQEEAPAPEEPLAASLNLVAASSYFARNDLLETDDEDEGDVDAVRVNEPGDGDITATVLKGPEDATLTVPHSSFDDDGRARPGGDDGLDVDESETAASDIPVRFSAWRPERLVSSRGNLG